MNGERLFFKRAEAEKARSLKKLTRAEEKRKEKEYHDFIFDIENSAKSIIKEQNKKQRNEALRAKVRFQKERNEARRRARKHKMIADTLRDAADQTLTVRKDEHGLPIASPGLHSQFGDALSKSMGFDSNKHLLEPQGSDLSRDFSKTLPAISSKNMIGQPERLSTTLKLTGLTRRSASPGALTPAKSIEIIRAKLARSPLAKTYAKGRGGNLFASPSNSRGSQSSIWGADALSESAPAAFLRSAESPTHKPKHTQVVVPSSRSIVKRKGHYAPGTIPPRPEHTVMHKYSVTSWINPSKELGIEKGLSKHAMDVLSGDNELQGPKNWSSIDLCMKYRDEKTRIEAHHASLMRQQEAKRIEREQHIIMPVVKVTNHPMHTDTNELVRHENSMSKSRARKRARMRVFALDMPTIWTANRPKQKRRLIKEGERADADEPGGLADRRDADAHEQAYHQVQSVTIERALKSTEAPARVMTKHDAEIDEPAPDLVRAKLQAIKTTGIEVERVSEWKQRGLQEFLRFMLRVSHGQVQGMGVPVVEGSDAYIVRAFAPIEWIEKRDLVKAKDWHFTAYSPSDSAEATKQFSHERVLRQIRAAHRSEYIDHESVMRIRRIGVTAESLIEQQRLSRLSAQLVAFNAAGVRCGYLIAERSLCVLDNGFIEASPRLLRISGILESAVKDVSLTAAALVSLKAASASTVKLIGKCARRRPDLGHVMCTVTVAASPVDDIAQSSDRGSGAGISHVEIALVAKMIPCDAPEKARVFAGDAISVLRWAQTREGWSKGPVGDARSIRAANWWFESSDERKELVRMMMTNFECFEDDDGNGVLSLKAFKSASAEQKDQVIKIEHSIATRAATARHPPIDDNQPVDFAPDSWRNDELVKRLLRAISSLDEDHGGLGIESVIAEAFRPSRTFLAEDLEEKDEASGVPLTLQVCGRFGAKEGFLGHPAPSASSMGLMDEVAALFTRDPKLTRTNSVLCNLSSCVSHALLAPPVLAWYPVSVTPPSAPEEITDSLIPWSVPPFTVIQVVSKLDYRESLSMMVLTGASQDLDIGGLERNKYEGHRRIDAAVTKQFFRIHTTARITELCCPDDSIQQIIYGVRRAAATLNACNSWPHRYTWHSEDLTREELAKKRIAKDYHYVVHRGATVGSNDPVTFAILLDNLNLRGLLLRSKTKLIDEDKERARVRAKKEEEDEIRRRVQENRRQKEEAMKERIRLQEELNEKRLKREKRLRGKHSTKTSAGTRVEDWERRVSDPTTMKMGTSGPWQAYLYLDSTAKRIIHEASIRAEEDRMDRLSRGEDPRPGDELAKEALDLAVKEGTLFYHNAQDNEYQWDQPRGWNGVALEPTQAYQASDKLEAIQAGATGTLIKRDLVASTSQLSEYEAAQLRKKKERELKSMRSRDATLAMEAADAVEHSRHLRVVEGRLRDWMDSHGVVATADDDADSREDVFDLRSVFKEIDEKGTGLVSHEEFKVALAQMGMKLEIKDQCTLIRHHDPNKNGVVCYGDFILFLLDSGAVTASQWFGATGDHPAMAPVQWEEKREGDRITRVSGNWEEYKETATGERYFFNASTGESSWEKPEEVRIADLQARDARELEQAQTAASLAARSAAAAAAQAERAGDKSIERLVQSLASSSEFVNLLAEQLQMEERLLRDKFAESELSGDDDSDEDSETDEELALLVPKLKSLSPSRSGRKKRRKKASKLEDDADGGKEEAGIQVEKPGLQWRLLRPAQIPKGFISAASEPHTMGFAHGLVTVNRPSLVGVVDPVEVSHVPMEEYPTVETKFIGNILEETERYLDDGANVDDMLDRSGEEAMLEMIHEAFLATKNSRIDKLEELMDNGVKVDERDGNGNTMLLIAAQQGLKRISKFLLRRGGDINAQNLSGNSILHYCFEYSFNDLAEYFISKGADDSLLNADGLTCYEGLNREKVDNI